MTPRAGKYTLREIDLPNVRKFRETKTKTKTKTKKNHKGLLVQYYSSLVIYFLGNHPFIPVDKNALNMNFNEVYKSHTEIISSYIPKSNCVSSFCSY